MSVVIRKQFCPKGHNKFVSGVNKFGQCLPCRRFQALEWKRKQPISRRRTDWRRFTLKREYGLTPEDYLQMFVQQSGRCAICQRPQSDFKRKLAVDHSHETNKIRGLLCCLCNTNLAVLEDKNFCGKASLYLVQGPSL